MQIVLNAKTQVGRIFILCHMQRGGDVA